MDTENPGVIAATTPAVGEAAVLERTIARSVLTAIRTFNRASDRVYYAMGWICGLELLLLGFFITYQVVARKLGWIMAPATDVMSGYVLAMAATWSFSYSLRTGSHVRIDALLPFMGRKTRGLADFMALGAVGFFAAVTAQKMWLTIHSNYVRHVISNDYPLTPLWIPKIVVGVGFTMLVFTVAQMMFSMLGEWLLPMWHKRLGGGEIASEQIVVTDVASVA